MDVRLGNTITRFCRILKRQAQQQTGRLLLKIRSSVACGRSYAEALPEDTFGVYDATAYAPQHPGLDQILIDAAEDEDRLNSRSRLIRTWPSPSYAHLPSQDLRLSPWRCTEEMRVRWNLRDDANPCGGGVGFTGSYRASRCARSA